MTRSRDVLHSLRVVAGSALMGTVVAGALFGWAPAILGGLTVHEVGALAGAALGVFANTRQLI